MDKKIFGVLFLITTSALGVDQSKLSSLVHINLGFDVEDTISPFGCSGFFYDYQKEGYVYPFSKYNYNIVTNIHCILDQYHYMALMSDPQKPYPHVKARDIHQNFYPDVLVRGYHPHADIVLLTTTHHDVVPQSIERAHGYQPKTIAQSHRFDLIYADQNIYPAVSNNNIVHVTRRGKEHDAMIFHNLEFILPGYSGGPITQNNQLIGINFFGMIPYFNLAYHESALEELIVFHKPIDLKTFFQNYLNKDQIIHNDVFGYLINTPHGYSLESAFMQQGAMFQALSEKLQLSSGKRVQPLIGSFAFLTDDWMFTLHDIYSTYHEDPGFIEENYLALLAKTEQDLDELYQNIRQSSFYRTIKNSVDCKFLRFYDLHSENLQKTIPDIPVSSCNAFFDDIASKQEALEKMRADDLFRNFSYLFFLDYQKKLFAVIH